jgi:hypothetical protein
MPQTPPLGPQAAAGTGASKATAETAGGSAAAVAASALKTFILASQLRRTRGDASFSQSEDVIGRVRQQVRRRITRFVQL